MPATYMGRLEADTTWSGDVHLAGDVFVPAGVRLRIEPGTRMRCAERPRWSCAVFWRSATGDSIEATVRERCDIVVAGRLEALGTPGDATSLGEDSGPWWGGITCLDRGVVQLKGALLVGASPCSIRVFDDGVILGRDARCSGAENAVWAWGSSRVSWAGGGIQAARASVLCCEGSKARLVGLEDESAEGVAALDWALVRADRCRFVEPRRHCVVARHRSWVKLSGCRMPTDGSADIVRLDEAFVEVSA